MGPRRFNRVDYLLARPKHKGVRSKFERIPVEERENSPMSMDMDRGKGNLPLLGILRRTNEEMGYKTKAGNKSVIDAPPSFYDQDQDKW